MVLGLTTSLVCSVADYMWGLPHFFPPSVIFSAANPDWILWRAVFGTLGLNGSRKPKLWFRHSGIERFFTANLGGGFFVILKIWNRIKWLNCLSFTHPSTFQQISRNSSQFLQAKKEGVHSSSLSGGITSITTTTWLMVTLSHSIVLVSRHCLASMTSFEIQGCVVRHRWDLIFSWFLDSQQVVPFLDNSAVILITSCFTR